MAKANGNRMILEKWLYDKGAVWPDPRICISSPTENSWKVSVDDDRETFIYHMKRKACCSNMQSNEACFESWLLFFRALGMKKVIFSWDGISNDELEKMIEYKEEMNAQEKKERNCARAYNRFLYRVYKFNQIFGSAGSGWFEVSEECFENLMDSALITDYVDLAKKYYVNQQGDRRKLLNSTNIDEEFEPNNQEEPDLNEKTEHEIERYFHARPSLFDLKELHYQLPVGLFTVKNYAEKHARFPARKGTIDLWSVDSESLKIFELKCPGNVQIGIFTELWFYSMFMNIVYHFLCTTFIYTISKYSTNIYGFI